MPIINIGMKFDRRGVDEAIRAFDKVGGAAGEAQRETRNLASSMSRFASAEPVTRLARRFAEVGVSIDTAGKYAQELAARMQKVSRENLFKQLGNDANLSALQLAKLRAGMGDVRGAFTTLTSAVGSSRLMVAAWGASLVLAGKAILDAQIELQRLEQSYRSVFGEGAAAQLQTVYEQTDRVGLKFFETAEAAKSFFAAGQGTPIVSELNAIFKAVTNAGAALQLSTEQVNGTFIALGQMLSKGKVQAEELRGQLGERLPGAFQMAARAMNMSTAELDKFMAEGRLLAEDLLPRLAEALQDQYGRAAEEAANTAQGSINRMSTEWTLFKANVMDSGPMVGMINAVTEALKRSNDVRAEQNERKALESQLSGMGIGPDEERVSYDSFGGEIRGKVYSEALLGWMRNQNAAAQAEVRLAEEAAAEQEAAIARGRSALTTALKETTQARIAALQEEKAKAEREITGLIEIYKAQGVDTRELENQRAAALAAFDAKIAEVGRKGSSAARSAAVAQSDYTGELERTRQQVEGLQQQLGLDHTEDLTKAKIKIEQKYQAELSKTNEELAKRVARGQLTPEQADTLRGEKAQAADLERRLALKEAEQKADERLSRNLETRVNFYKELARLSGNYEQSLEEQNRLVQKQKEEWERAGIAAEDVARRVELMKQELSRDPFDGLARGARKWANEATDLGRQMETFITDTLDNTADSFAEFCLTGKASFSDLANSIISDLYRIASKQFLGGIGNMLGGGLLGGGGGISGSAIHDAFYSDALTGIFHSGGMVGYGAPADGYRSVRAALFSGAPRFHSGGGYFGPDEYPAILLRGERVLNRRETQAYNAGQASINPTGGIKQDVTVNVINQTSQNVEAQTQTRQDANGGISLDIILKQVDSGMAGLARQGKSQFGAFMQKAYGLDRAGTIMQGRGRA